MPIIAGGIVTLKPIGGLIGKNSNMTDAQAQEAMAQRAVKRQEKVDTFINKVADANKDANNKPRWSVPFN